ncbi:glycosyltransferase [Synechococcus sp. MIT S9508]|uniref:glycosyltransferase n=1 Tax=Synechococcus sp. MIT S9508 TaxID=1801629 RepID=UPI001E3DD8B1
MGLNQALHLIGNNVDVSLVYVNDSPWNYFPIDNLVDAVKMSLAPFSISEIIGLNLSQNLGHQKALITGLAYAYNKYAHNSQYILMDCDGEDRPIDVPRLYDSINNLTPTSFAVVASRKRRHEDRVFKLGYFLYKIFFKFLSGKRIDFGNFMILRSTCALALIKSPVAQSHIATALIRSRFPFTSLPVSRGFRYSGSSKMGGKAKLITLGIIAIGTFAEEVITRFLIVNSFALCSMFFVSLILVINFFFGVFPPIPGWTSSILVFLLGISLLLGLQLLNAIFSLSVLRNLDGVTGFDMVNDYIESVEIKQLR